MRILIVAGTCLLFGASLAAQSTDSSSMSGKALTWGPAPAVFPAGAKMAVVSGNPMTAGTFIIQLSMPDGYKIMPHTHPTDENVTVKKGTFNVGMGDKWDAGKAKPMATGASGTVPAHMSHFAQTKGATVVEVTAVGPFAMTYVNPSDDPSKKMAP